MCIYKHIYIPQIHPQMILKEDSILSSYKNTWCSPSKLVQNLDKEK